VDTFLSFGHQTLISRLCNDLAIPLSEFNFANLYLFRKIHQYRLIELYPSHYAITGNAYDGHSFLMVLFHPTDWKSCLHAAKEYQADYLFPIPQDWFGELSMMGYSLDISEDDSDYLYEAESIRTLKGRHLDGQRNLIRNLLSEHSIIGKDLSLETTSEAFSIIDSWEKEHKDRFQVNDVAACREAVENWAKLGLQGWIYEIDSSPAGLLIGGLLTANTYLYHFSKTSFEYRKLSSFMHHDAAFRINQRYTILNWAQDLGIKGLRYSKRSYHPLAMGQKGKLWI
jgi:uncharacterized protein